MDTVNALKEQGNEALKNNNVPEAISAYTKAIEIDPSNHVLWSNRSAAYAQMGNYKKALKDAEKTIELNPSWPKGHSRKAAALEGIALTEAGESFLEKMDVDESAMPPPPSSSSFATTTNKTTSASSFTKRSTTNNKPVVEEEDPNLPENKKLAKHEKNLGNEQYKKKAFNEAIEHYNAAIEHDSTDITLYSNLAAVYFERKEYDKCIAECEKGISIGRENRADFKLIAKAFARIANAYRRLENWQSAKTFYEKSLSEHRTPDVKTQLSEVEKKIKESEIRAYIDPAKAEEEKELGNKLFKKGDFSTAIKHYSEAIRRNPDDPKLYSNRAACYTKLAAFDLGLKDCETCLTLDEKFIKGWIRKGKILQGMQQSVKASEAYQKAIELDPNNTEAVEGYRACSMAYKKNPQEVWKRAMANPEIQQILKDPAMRVILEQMQNDPRAMQDHLKNPAIAGKIQKLLESGIIEIH